MTKRLNEIAEEPKKIFLKKLIDKIARKTEFVQRNSKLNAEKFILICVFLNEALSTNSLSELCAKL